MSANPAIHISVRLSVTVVLLLTTLLAAGMPGPRAQPLSTKAATGPAQHRGGSDYIFYDLQGCERSQFPVVPAYHAQRKRIDAQLREMYRGGQRRLRIGLPLQDTHEAAGDAAYLREIAEFLSSVRDIGYEEVLVVIGGGERRPESWKSWDEAGYRRRWSRIVEFRRILTASGLRYRLDLLNEGIPARNQPILLDYTRRLWSDYSRTFGTQDTVGFSIITDVKQDRFAQIPAVYQGRLPPVFDLHVYDRPAETLLNADRRLSELGLGRIPWIIGESYYNDLNSAEELSRALLASGRRVLFLLQWPLTRLKRCGGVDVPYPARFDNYIAAGF